METELPALAIELNKIRQRMKIIYIAYWDVSGESGVLKKIISQLKEWRSQGNEIELLALSPCSLVWNGAKTVPVKVFIRGNLIKRFLIVRSLVEHAVYSSCPCSNKNSCQKCYPEICSKGK